MDEKLEFWENTGLLENMPLERKIELSRRLDELAHYLISLKKEHGTDSLIFPVLCRIYRQAMIPVGKFAFFVDTSQLVQDLRNKWDDIDMDNMPIEQNGVDTEAEFSAIFCEDYVNELKKNR